MNKEDYKKIISENIQRKNKIMQRFDNLRALYNVLLKGTEAVDPEWDRLVAASVTMEAIEELEKYEKLKGAAIEVINAFAEDNYTSYREWKLDILCEALND